MPKINPEEYETLKGLNDKWKWIATDGDGYVWGYEYRPKKLGRTQMWDDSNGGQYMHLGPNLFQFIQWEDEEPYSIDELIDEYEEATRAVKKDRAWLKEALFALRMTGKPENNRTERERELGKVQQWAWNNCVDRAHELAEELDESQANREIDKLANFIMSEVEDEPSQSQGAVDTAIRIIQSYQNQETLSQDWIDEHAEYYEYLGYEVVPVNDLQKLLMPEQEETDRYIQGWVEGIAEYVKDLESGENLIVVDKPIIPQFVAEWYESEGKRDRWWNWFYKWGKDKSETELEAKTIKWMQDYNEETFVNMFLYGYTVEEEQKYYVDLDAAAYVARWVGDGSVQIHTDSISWDNEYEFYLTEQEIKDYDPRFWPFAVKVEELEDGNKS